MRNNEITFLFPFFSSILTRTSVVCVHTMTEKGECVYIVCVCDGNHNSLRNKIYWSLCVHAQSTGKPLEQMTNVLLFTFFPM